MEGDGLTCATTLAPYKEDLSVHLPGTIRPEITLICDCPGYTYRLYCWHVSRVADAISKGWKPDFPIEYRSRTDARKVYRIERLVDEK